MCLYGSEVTLRKDYDIETHIGLFETGRGITLLGIGAQVSKRNIKHAFGEMQRYIPGMGNLFDIFRFLVSQLQNAKNPRRAKLCHFGD